MVWRIFGELPPNFSANSSRDFFGLVSPGFHVKPPKNIVGIPLQFQIFEPNIFSRRFLPTIKHFSSQTQVSQGISAEGINFGGSHRVNHKRLQMRPHVPLSWGLQNLLRFFCEKDTSGKRMGLSSFGLEHPIFLPETSFQLTSVNAAQMRLG